MKKIVFILLFIYVLFGNFLQIHQKIIPITLLQIENIANKGIKAINILVVTKGYDLQKAYELKENFPKEIKTFKINLKIITQKELISYLKWYGNKIDAIYGINLEKSDYNYINNSNFKIPTFGYSFGDLKNGALLFIEFTDEIKIYLNKKTMKKLKIDFNNQFLEMVEIYE